MRRIIRWETIAIAIAAVAVIVSFLVVAWSARERSRQLNDILFHQCITNEAQDTVIVSLITAEKWRAKATYKPTSPILNRILETLNDDILTLEPPDERDCTR